MLPRRPRRRKRKSLRSSGRTRSHQTQFRRQRWTWTSASSHPLLCRLRAPSPATWKGLCRSESHRSAPRPKLYAGARAPAGHVQSQAQSPHLPFVVRTVLTYSPCVPLIVPDLPCVAQPRRDTLYCTIPAPPASALIPPARESPSVPTHFLPLPLLLLLPASASLSPGIEHTRMYTSPVAYNTNTPSHTLLRARITITSLLIYLRSSHYHETAPLRCVTSTLWSGARRTLNATRL